MKRAEWSGVERPRLSRLFESLAGDVILRFVSGRRVLDLGHGSDEVLHLVRERAAGRVAVVEFAEIDTAADDLGLGRFDANAFDTIYTLQSFPHLGTSPDEADRSARSFLVQCARLCAPGGYVLAQLVNPRSLWGVAAGIRQPITIMSGRALVERGGTEITRFDTLNRFVSLLPPELELVDSHGIGVLTPTSGVLGLPIIGRVVEHAEWWLHDHRWMRPFGAHVLAVCRRLPATMTVAKN